MKQGKKLSGREKKERNFFSFLSFFAGIGYLIQRCQQQVAFEFKKPPIFPLQNGKWAVRCRCSYSAGHFGKRRVLKPNEMGARPH